MAGCRFVYHVAADYRIWVPDPRPMFRTNVEGTRDLLTAALDAGVERVVYTSSVATLGLVPGGSADETTPSRVEDMIGPYKRSKFEAEEVARQLARERGLPVVIVNPSTPVGPGDIKPTPTGRLILEAARGQMPAFVDTGLNIVHVDDVAAGHLAAAEKGRIGERYILGGENMSLAEILAEVSRAVGRRASPPARPARRAVPGRVRRGTRRAGHRPRAVRDARRRPHVAQEDVFHTRKRLGASSATARGRRARRSPTRSAGSGPTAICNDWGAHRLGVGSRRQCRNPVGKMAQRGEFPGRIFPDPARPAAACACLLSLCPKRRRHCRQPRAERRARRSGGSTGWRQSSTARAGEDSPAAAAMRESLAETGVTAQHCHDVLHAFRLDAVKLRYRDWDDLMAYCRYSASPVGRQLLDLHGESRDTWPPFGRAVLGAAGAQPSARLRR